MLKLSWLSQITYEICQIYSYRNYESCPIQQLYAKATCAMTKVDCSWQFRWTDFCLRMLPKVQQPVMSVLQDSMAQKLTILR